MIELKHIKKSFENSTPLVDINAQINKGDVVALIGPSGCGKSTLLKLICLLTKPTSGQILYDGVDITSPDYKTSNIYRNIGLVFQHFNLFPHLTVVENIMRARMDILKKPKQDAYDKAIELLQMVGMEKHALSYPRTLSGGQKQRVAIARALALEQETILFDEPTSALDPTMVADVEHLIRRLNKMGHTMIIVTHDFKFAKSVANRVFYLDQGTVYEEGTPDEIFVCPKKERTIQFIRSLSHLDLLVTEENHNLALEIEKIYTFCISKGIDTKRTHNICSGYEEYLNMLYNYAFADIRTVRFTLEFETSTNKVFLSFVPYSLKDWSEVQDVISNSLENKIFISYLKSAKEDTIKTDDGDHIRYTYEM